MLLLSGRYGEERRRGEREKERRRKVDIYGENSFECREIIGLASTSLRSLSSAF